MIKATREEIELIDTSRRLTGLERHAKSSKLSDTSRAEIEVGGCRGFS